MMKKAVFLALLICLIWPTWARAAVNVKVKALAPGFQYWDAATTSIKVPSLVQATDTVLGGSAIEWITLAIPASKVASMAVKIGATVALGYIGKEFIDYLADEAFAPDPTTGAMQKVNTIPGQLQPASAAVQEYINTQLFPWNTATFEDEEFIYVADYNEAYAMKQAVIYTYDGAYPWQSGPSTYPQASNNYFGFESVTHAKPPTGQTQISKVFIYNTDGLIVQGQPTQTMTTPTSQQLADLETAIEDDVEAGQLQSLKAIEQMLSSITHMLANPQNNPISNASKETAEHVQQKLDESVTAEQTTAVSSAITGGYVVGGANPANTFSGVASGVQTGTQTGTQTGVDPVTGGQTVTDPVTGEQKIGTFTGPEVALEALPEVPEKSMIAIVLSDWWNGFLQLPVLSLLNSFEVTASGTSVVSFTIPGFLGGSGSTANFDFGQYAATWDFMGNILLLITGVRWTMYLFEG